ncbi:MAG: hypothetical protein QW607_12295 [Desulfurococcaceae archaeon]
MRRAPGGECVKMNEVIEEIRKTVKIKNTVYAVGIDSDGVYAQYTVYPHAGWGNNYGTVYRIKKMGRKWYEIVAENYNNCWACRGHGMDAWWTDNICFVAKDSAEKFIENIIKKIKEAENGTPDVKMIYDEFIEYAEKNREVDDE